MLDPEVEDFLKSSDDLLEEHDLPDKDQSTIEEETESLSKRWNKVKSDAKSREPKYVHKVFNSDAYFSLVIQHRLNYVFTQQE